jgi:hypothetical protein
MEIDDSPRRHGDTEEEKTSHKDTKGHKVLTRYCGVLSNRSVNGDQCYEKKNPAGVQPDCLWAVLLMRSIAAHSALSLPLEISEKSGPRCYGPKGFAFGLVL